MGDQGTHVPRPRRAPPLMPMTPAPDDPRGRPPLRLAPRGPRRGWGARTLGTLPGLLVTLAMLGLAFGAGRLGSRLLGEARARDAVRAERVSYAAPSAPRPSVRATARPVESGAPASSPGPARAVETPAATPGAPVAATPLAPAAPDTGAGGPPGERIRAAARAAARALTGPPAEAAPPAAVPGRVGASLVGPPLTAAQKDSALDVYRGALGVRGPGPLFPVHTDVGRALAGSRPGELTQAQRSDMARALMADDIARTTPSPCGMSPGVERPGGGPRQTPQTVCGMTAGMAVGGGASRVTLGPGTVSIPLPFGGPSAKRRARDAAVHAENQRILARIRDRRRRRADSLSWIAESTRAARDSVARAAGGRTPG